MVRWKLAPPLLQGYADEVVPNLPADVARPLCEYRRLLGELFGERLEMLRLFGSRARGDSEPESDVDVAVVILGLTEPERTRAVELATLAWRTAGRPDGLLSPLVWSSAEFADRLAAERRIALDVRDEGVAV